MKPRLRDVSWLKHWLSLWPRNELPEMSPQKKPQSHYVFRSESVALQVKQYSKLGPALCSVIAQDENIGFGRKGVIKGVIIV